MTTNTRRPGVALVWWSPTRAAWGCQIDDQRTYHYSEAEAEAHGRQLVDEVHSRSVIAGEWV